MKTKLLIITVTVALLFPGCASQEERTARVERRQDNIDHRTEGRQERWKVRAERQDARAASFVESQ